MPAMLSRTQTQHPITKASITRGAALLGLVAFEIGAIVLLHQLGSQRWMTIPWGDIPTWLEVASREDVVAAVIRSIALVLSYWIAASTGLYTLARLSRVPRVVRAAAWATLPPIRRIIDRTIAVTVTTAALVSPLAPAVASDGVGVPAPPSTEPVIFQISERGVPTPVNVPSMSPADSEPTVIVPPGVGDAGYTPAPAGRVGDVVINESAYEVVSGDNLWSISCGHLRASFPDREFDAAAIAVYWRQVMEVNTPTLRSGDPNLIFPGEQIVLPEVVLGERP